MKIDVFWDAAPCNLVEIDKSFRAACCLHHQGDHLRDYNNPRESSVKIARNATYILNGYFRNTKPVSEILGTQGDEYDDGCLLGCSTVTLIMEAVSSPETSVNIYQTSTRCYIAEGSYQYVTDPSSLFIWRLRLRLHT
jgi:hypothetical protein